ncbi:recombinase family protein [Streptomyces rimosus]|uniref:recombinase family protein n=1 Tax=Streptomyces rimosus TaxID=1927 RepID=UPI00378FAEA5
MTITPLVFIYDRNATGSSAYLDMRIEGCRNYAASRKWTVADHWVDRGDDALADTRPQLSALLEILRREAGIRPVICLLHSWGRLAADPVHRIAFQQRVARAGGYCATTFNESDELAHEALAL